EDGIRVFHVTGVQTCALPIYGGSFVATGDNGTLLMSGDSSGWGRIDLGTTARLRGAAYGNNNANPGNDDKEEIETWVVVGDGGRSEERRVGKECGVRCVSDH